MASYLCPGCGAVYNGKKCRACGYTPFSNTSLPGEPVPARIRFRWRKRSHPFLGFVLLLCLIAGSIPLMRNFGLELEAREAALSTEPPQTLPAETDVTETVPLPTVAPRFVFDSVPVYYQTDYPFIRYGDGTIATSGCSITCLAMAASYVTDQVYTPDMIAHAFGGYGENNIQRLDYAIEQMQLPCVKNHDWRQTQKALKEGNIAIIMVDERSGFTTSSHFILITGINEQGRYEVIDPLQTNYKEAYLLEGFEKGFTEEQILAGLEGSWVFRKDQMGSFRYAIEMPDLPKTRYGDYRPTDPDVELLAQFLWAAAREESPETQQALAELVLNRIADPAFPYLPEQVLRQEDLYTWYRQSAKARPEVAQYSAVTNAIYGPHVLPENVLYFSHWQQSREKTWGKLGNFYFLYAQ